ncbi:MAG: hypothetical protein QM696_04315 [Steroidobacteraceae bacterium]
MQNPGTTEVDLPDDSLDSEPRSVMAQIEAAVRLGVLELTGENTGTDPYNSGRAARGNAWDKSRPR